MVPREGIEPPTSGLDIQCSRCDVSRSNLLAMDQTGFRFSLHTHYELAYDHLASIPLSYRGSDLPGVDYPFVINGWQNPGTAHYHAIMLG